MNTKAWIAAAAALLATTALTGAAFAQDKSKTPIKVAIFSVNAASPTIHAMIESATAAAKARGWTVETYDGNGDQVATNNQVNTFIHRGFDALINVASANTQMGGVIANANKAKIPFVSTFSGMVPGITVDIGSNNVADGVFAASEIAARIDGEGEVLKLNWTVLPALAERDAGFHAVMSEYKKIKVTEMELKVPGQVDDTFNKVTDFLTGHKDVKAIWMGWDEVGVAAARAVQQSHVEKKPFVVSMDGNDAAYDLIRDGSPLALTVAYDVRGMGDAAVQSVADAVDGKSFPERQIYKKPCLITKATVPAKGQYPDFKTCALYSADMPNSQ
ncbi:ABC-type sugar transport system substrate-binding protein [Roseiarcus fermentans]|uniref:ABC-type sugar transport system substrate-binding protein n=1 Tax=Roseiarcus fermentans TaxID=1473586 RepID=A0A366FSW2_9HYPH|nr:sugar ABC transporter substrate-binding protein [Roseiarcus fermentans]RBP17621.1 ABC-type sugar transport system substrate-binding protein [Roseiarcus fermentans]